VVQVQGGAPVNDLAHGRQVPPGQGPGPPFQKGEEGRVLDEGHLNGFGHPADPVFLGQGGEESAVVKHRRRGSKDAQKVFLAHGVDAVFHPDGRIGLGQDGGGHPEEPDAPVGGGRGEAHGVDEGPATHRRHIGVAAQPRGLHGLVQEGDV